ncbi:MAG: 2-dehydropantoate 2-reductase [Rhodothermia bacterium]|nr:2-dehydropantoate 2-reductase [Rhodothermia bacterium]
MTKTKILIAGIGGVGGYFGGVLAKQYFNSNEIEVCFFARGQHLDEIQKNGLKILSNKDEFIANPKIATDNPNEIGIADLIIVCTKSYDIENIIKQLKPCINQKTFILPLLNGVDNKEKIQILLPENTILDGCVYIVSRLKKPGIVEKIGNIQTLYFGKENFINDQLEYFRYIFNNANIEATLSQNISSIIWEKFIFISPTATATTFLDKNIGEIVSENHIETITKLIQEVKQIAKAKNIDIAENITEITINKLKSLPFDATSSMHTDFKNKESFNELKSLTKYVIEQGIKYNIETPTYIKAYNKIKSGI